jgi:diaminopimelate epimerase
MRDSVGFVKMQALGNDFVVVEDDKVSVNRGSFSARVCERRTGVGADGVLFVKRLGPEAVSMRVYNSDGSESSMCGNGIRCLARYAFDQGLVQKRVFTVQTLAGDIKVVVSDTGSLVQVSMGIPRRALGASTPSDTGLTADTLLLRYLERNWEIHEVMMGGPHAVIFVTDVSETPVASVGAFIEKHPSFPDGVNVTFTEVLSRQRLKLRTWERGAGLTLACGTGACAAVAEAAGLGLIEDQVSVELALGELIITRQNDGRLEMLGPAEYAFTGLMS